MAHNHPLHKLFVFLWVIVWLSACVPQSPPSGTPSNAPTAISTLTPRPTEVVRPTLWIDPMLPAAFRDQISIPEELDVASEESSSTLQLSWKPDSTISIWIYALTAPFPTLTDEVKSSDLLQFWKNHNAPFPTHKLLLDPAALQAFSKLWGAPDPGSVQIVEDENEILGLAWEENQPWAIIPFEKIEPRWKVITVDGLSPIHKDFSEGAYPLQANIGLAGDASLINALLSNERTENGHLFGPLSNRDSEKLTTLALTGVTALVRATAGWMEIFGLTYPGQDIRDILIEADITHINNEIPFSPKCPPPYPREETLVFCSKPKYIELLKDIGTDIVELDGDHFQDWGPEAVLFTMDLYEDMGWKTYGGGRNLEDARKPVLLTHNGNQLAFLGCNAKEAGYAGADIDQPGAYHCDIEWMQSKIRELLSEGYLPVVTFQHIEYYSYIAHDPQMLSDFRAMADAGAVVVSGSQAHQPQSMEFYNNAFLHYGLGNLFFDQYYEGIPTRQSFIDRHVFYDGRHISTELISLLFVDYARPRPMTKEERLDLLQTIFQASNWGPLATPQTTQDPTLNN